MNDAPVPVAPDMVARITTELEAIAAAENVAIPLAVESGSRAWGFHSPDSDFDVRFVYVQPTDWHLSVFPGRDVIERPISDVLDISGWDLRKTLGLILKSNAVILEWLQSPVRYLDHEGLCAELMAFAHRALRRKPVMWHYLRLAQRQNDRLRDGEGNVRLKRYFYVIRPTLALRWMRLRPDEVTPPMYMTALLDGADLDAALRAEIDTLTARKMAQGEMGTAKDVPEAVDNLISDELTAAEHALGETPPDPPRPLRDEADDLLRRWTHHLNGMAVA